ncbi:hypothetical protein DFP93_101232 [Aneurinibacillus soli]|uniref:Uncharacterized protein n=1 Tax=Aneurinibacillus soli TaxID=1500254 RepID=A0A0U5BB80_9BACL|nr:hypothetical protein [Aneurinibacillus soli]PYE64207.1 hypothetical protein DFP93_101232 [Aneurinibacillus soli]BAU28156.1 hypothetical protein CB4_02330 [Aneurinibacillus soli]
MSKEFISFDAGRYLQALAKTLEKAVQEIGKDLQQKLRAKVGMIPFRSHKVTLESGMVTDDTTRGRALADSIQTYASGQVSLMANRVYRTAVTAMERNFEQSHIGLYYEYGTGTLELPNSPLPRMGEWNPARNNGVPAAGAPIVTRSGMWRDAGGNIRTTISKTSGRAIGDPSWETPALRWFANTFQENKSWYYAMLMEAVKSVNPGKYIKLRKSIRIMR